MSPVFHDIRTLYGMLTRPPVSMPACRRSCMANPSSTSGHRLPQSELREIIGFRFFCHQHSGPNAKR